MTPRVRVVHYASRPVVSKITRFDFEIPRMEREIAVYRAINGCGVGSAFLGHIVHGDPNKNNSVVASEGTVTLIDFKNAMLCRSAEQKNEELATLPAQLSETTGRRGVVLRQLVY
ncbi:hypothetical protein EDB19DRAFT_1103386 [Suillus lakei]|nr:hypothetical protein EDB19DRAFT_1103386 [Suillus lakei]